MAASRTPHADEYSPVPLPPVSLSLQWATAALHLPQETLQDQQVGLAYASIKSLLFPLGPGAHETLCAPSKSGVSVSPSPLELLRSSPAGLQSQMLWGFLLLMPDHWSLTWGLRTLTPMGEPYNIIICQFVGHLPSGYGIWLWMQPSYRLVVASLFWEVEIFFGRF